ncbi:MAG: twin-arginine translocase subunit TatC [Candidatus Binatia bacterium]|nr:twin-arginine translocase subunit TatC [Candidatus Binatia bacterium]
MPEAEMPLTDHLEELRWRIMKIFAFVMIGFGASYAFSDTLFEILTRPIQLAGDGKHVMLIGTGVAEAFFTKLKVAFIAGIFLASPAILFQLWGFIAPGLHDQEKYYVIPFVLFGTFFFVAGAAFCYLLVFQVGYRFFLEQYATIGIEPTLRISEYLSFSSRLLLAFGITFELPVLAFFLARIGMIDHNSLIKPWRYAIIGIVILAAVLTPGPDVASQMLLAAPLIVLYGVSIIVAYVFSRVPARPDEEDPADDTDTND